MRSLWWVWTLVFLAGIGAGSWLGLGRQTQESDIPAFAATTPAETDAPNREPVKLPQSREEYGLPCTFQDTAIKALTLVSYDGPYWEDGSGEDVFAVAALLVENTGNIGLDYVRITVCQGTRELVFDSTYIPPQSKVLILEESRQPYSSEPVGTCKCNMAVPGNFDCSERLVKIEDVGLSGMKVTNCSQEPLADLYIYYKHYSRDDGMYLGGITYSVTVKSLQPGQTVELHPYRYTPGYTQVVAVKPG